MSHLSKYGYTVRRARARGLKPERGGRRRAAPVGAALTLWQVLQNARKQVLTTAQFASPLMGRPYDFRHSGVSWRLNAGTPAPLVAEWAGHKTWLGAP